MPAWRSSLPKQPDDVVVARRDARIQSEMEIGPSKVRRRSTKTYETWMMTLHFSAQQVEEFIDFWDTDLGGGVATFTWEHPITDVTKTVRFVGGMPDFSMLRGGEAQDRYYMARIAVETT